ncbi:MAG: hypothetical protein LC125_03590 [Burkholderiales bacterium]|nr:hypothetical protein [Burkholderiales bacterium]
MKTAVALIAGLVFGLACGHTVAQTAAPAGAARDVLVEERLRELPAPLLSADGRWRLVAEDAAVIVQQSDGPLRRVHPALSLDGREQGRPSALLALSARRSFVLAFDGLPELWEIALDPQAEPIFDGYVHDYRMGEGIAKPGFLGVRRTRLQEPLRALVGDGAYVLGRAADVDAPGRGRARLVLVQLDVRRPIARFEPDADPDLGQAQLQQEDDRRLLVIPDRRGGAALRIDLRAARLLPR